MAATLPRDGVGVYPTVIADVTAAIDFGISIHHLFVPTLSWNADPIAISRHRGRVNQEDKKRHVLAFAQKDDHATLSIVEIDPLESFIGIIALPKCRFSLVDIIQMLDQASQTAMKRV